MAKNTALADAFAKAGWVKREWEFATAYKKFLDAGGRYPAAINIISRINDKFYAARGLNNIADGYDGNIVSVTNRSDGKGHKAPYTSSKSVPKPSQPLSAARLKAMKAVARSGANTIFESFTIRDGRGIGEVRYGELERLESTNAVEAAVVRYIRMHAGGAPKDSYVRDLIKSSMLEKLVQQAREEVSDAI